MKLRRAVCSFLLVTVCIVAPAFATSPHIESLTPAGGQRGTELEAIFAGERLQDTQEIFCYEPGIQILKLNFVTNKTVTAQLKIAPDCALGEHHLRIRSAPGFLSSLPSSSAHCPKAMKKNQITTQRTRKKWTSIPR